MNDVYFFERGAIKPYGRRLPALLKGPDTTLRGLRTRPLPPSPSAVEETWTIGRVIAWTSEFFKRKGLDAPRLTAELLLGSTLSLDRVHLYTDFDRPLQKDELAAYRALVQRRASGEPTHYLLGRREFYGRSFRVDPRVLVPRPETEMLIEAALECLGDCSETRALDLCTGSGCVGVTLAAERPSLRVVATDASLPALEVARENASAHGVADRVELRAGDLFAPVAREHFELITANPPYVETSAIEGLSPEVRREPREALDGGPDGLALIRRLIAGAREHLSPGGWLLFEIGDRQGPAVLDLLGAAGFPDASVQKDFAGFDRLARVHRA